MVSMGISAAYNIPFRHASRFLTVCLVPLTCARCMIVWKWETSLFRKNSQTKGSQFCYVMHAGLRIKNSHTSGT